MQSHKRALNADTDTDTHHGTVCLLRKIREDKWGTTESGFVALHFHGIPEMAFPWGKGPYRCTRLVLHSAGYQARVRTTLSSALSWRSTCNACAKIKACCQQATSPGTACLRKIHVKHQKAENVSNNKNWSQCTVSGIKYCCMLLLMSSLQFKNIYFKVYILQPV